MNNENIQKEEEYIDDCTLTKEDLIPYDVDATYEKVIVLLAQLRIARNKYINGYHARLTSNYTPRLEQFTNKISDPVGDEVEFKLDSEQAYTEFNIQLRKLYSIMSKEENAYINDCLICGKTEQSVKDKFNISKEKFRPIKDSAIIRFGIVFNIVVYK